MFIKATNNTLKQHLKKLRLSGLLSSLEARLHAMGHAYAFLDFRKLDDRSPMPIRLPKYDVNSIPDVGRVYDGLFYIDRMARATRAT